MLHVHMRLGWIINWSTSIFIHRFPKFRTVKTKNISMGMLNTFTNQYMTTPEWVSVSETHVSGSKNKTHSFNHVI